MSLLRGIVAGLLIAALQIVGGHFWFEYAAVALLSGDRSGYAQACKFLTENSGKKAGPRKVIQSCSC